MPAHNVGVDWNIESVGSKALPNSYRLNLTASDKLTSFTDGQVTLSDVVTGGTLTAGTTYYAVAIPGNRYGSCQVNPTIPSIATASDANNTHCVQMTIPQCAGAEWYDVFITTDAAPKCVARVTEAQRAAGGVSINGQGTTGVATNPAGTILIKTIGSGIQTSDAAFAANNAFTPASVPIINCTGYTKAWVYLNVSVTDMRKEPALTIVPFFGTNETTPEWYQGQSQVMSMLAGASQALHQTFTIDVSSAQNFAILIGTIAGQGVSANIKVELSR